MSKIRIAMAGLGVSALLLGGAMEPAMAKHSKTKIKVHKSVKSKGGNGGSASGANGGSGGSGGAGGAVVCLGNTFNDGNGPAFLAACGSVAGSGAGGGNGGNVTGGAGGDSNVTGSNTDTWTTVGNTAQAG